MALHVLAFARATEPHLPTLAAALAPILSAANAGSFHLRYAGGVVLIEQASFTGVNQTSVSNAVAAAPVRTVQLDAKQRVDELSLVERAAYQTLLDLVNVERARHSAAAISVATFVANVKTKVDAL